MALENLLQLRQYTGQLLLEFLETLINFSFKKQTLKKKKKCHVHVTGAAIPHAATILYSPTDVQNIQ